MIAHSKPVAEYYKAIQVLVDIQTKGTSHGAFIERLKNGLRKGGASGGNDGKEYSSGSHANLAILEFKQFLDTLTVKEKNKLFNYRDEDYSIKDCWDHLAPPPHECDLHILSELPSSLSGKQFSYIWIPQEKTLYYLTYFA